MKNGVLSSTVALAFLAVAAIVLVATPAAAENSIGAGMSLTQTNILGVFAELDAAPGLAVQANLGIDRARQFEITGFGVKGIYEVIPAISLVGGLARWQNSHVVLIGARYTDRVAGLTVYAGVLHQYVLESKKANAGVEAGFKLVVSPRVFLGAEGGYRVMEDGTPGVSAYVGYTF